MKITLRDYQVDSAEALGRSLDQGRHPLCVLPTGSGKSLVLAATIKARNQNALVLSHVAELLEQDARALRYVAPELSQSFYIASLREKDPTAQVVFGSVQSVCRSLAAFRINRPLVFIDEAHLCPRKADAMYAQVFAHFLGSQRVGFTATPKRIDSGSLVGGDAAWFNDVACEVDVAQLIKEGYLLPLIGIQAQAQADLTGVAKRGGDFVADQAAEATVRTLSLPQAIAQAVTLAKGRKSWLVFAASIEHAQQVAAELSQHKVSNAVVTSETPRDERRSAVARFNVREVRALINVGVFTTGFDAPMTDCIVSMRPTCSDVLWTQMLGRGMRLAQGKENCLLLDFVGNLERLGGVGCVREIEDLRNSETKVARAVKPVRRPRDDPALFDASSADPMLNGKSIEASVTRLRYFTVRSKRYPGRTLLIAAYSLEDEMGRALEAKEFLCLEYPGSVKLLAHRWFARRGIEAQQMPTRAEQGKLLAQALDAPSEVLTRYDRSLRSYVIESERFA